MTKDILHTRLAQPHDRLAIFDMYSDLKTTQDYPAFRSNAFYRAIDNVIEHAREAERLFVVTNPTDTPIGMGHLTRPFSLTGKNRSSYTLSHLYVDETQSEAFVTPAHLVDYAARLALYSGNSRTIEPGSVSLSGHDTNCLDIIAAHYPESQTSPTSIRFEGDTLRAMAARALPIAPAAPGLGMIEARHS